MILQAQKMLFEQIADYFRGLIVKGVYAPGDALPSVREVAMQEKVNPNTVVKAYGLLEEQGLLVSVPKKGYFVKQVLALKNEVRDTLRHLFSKGYTFEDIRNALEEMEVHAND